jgi:hypothetical protein
MAKAALRAILVAGIALVAGCSSQAPQSSKVIAPVSIRVELDRKTVTAGTPIQGSVVATNNTHRPITIQNGKCQVDAELAVGLINAEVSFYPAFDASACQPHGSLEPGSSRYKVTIYTTYLGCSPTAADSSDPHPIICTSKGTPPPLPTGRYETKVVFYGLPAHSEFGPPISVTLKRSAG